jgi:hypothetical protein
MLKHLQRQIDLPCRLLWGTDPKIQLQGTAIELGPDGVTVSLEATDTRLLPQPGRKVQVAIEWPAVEGTPEKLLTCRGLVEQLLDANGSGIRLRCSIVRGRFQDANSTERPPRKSATARGGWTM